MVGNMDLHQIQQIFTLIRLIRWPSWTEDPRLSDFMCHYHRPWRPVLQANSAVHCGKSDDVT